MTFLSEQDKQHLDKLIRQYETRTRGELVTVIANRSDGYRYIPLLWAALAALSVFPFAYFFKVVLSLYNLTLLQLGIFFVIATLFQLPFLRRVIVPKSVQHHRARRLAYETFYDLGIHHASHRAGIMIFVSVEEHYVQIIADEGADKMVPAETWQNAVSEFITHVKSGAIVAGFEQCIKECGAVLVEHFPASSETPSDELPNRIIEIDGSQY